jgi:release factor glutamine methyltransferase
LAPEEGGGRYLPAEDTYLLRDALERFKGDSCLEMGFGSGAVLESVSGRFGLAAGTDVLPLEDAKLALRAPLQLVLADRATCFRDGVFDLVFFNPPYLPSETIEDEAVDGGPTGVEVPVAFLGEALRVLREDGTIVALLSNEGDLESFLSHCGNLGLEVDSITEKRLFYETLSVFTIKRPVVDRERGQS